jgi:tRNA (guanine37-N1)-methyltransferase
MPGGEAFQQARAADLAGRTHLVLVCPRYEGIDDRIRDPRRHRALDRRLRPHRRRAGRPRRDRRRDPSLARAIDEASTIEESFSAGLLEYPQFTRPAEFRGQGVPDVLVSGNHEAVRRWRHDAAVARTKARRPDLLPPE